MGPYDKISPPTSAAKGDQRTRRRSLGVVGLVVGLAAFMVTSGSPAGAATAPVLGTAESFAVLAASTVTNTGPSVISGDLGVSPGDAVEGFPPGTVVNGTIHRADEVAANAQADALIAYNNLAGQACPPENDLTDQDLGGMELTPGVYCFSSSAQLTGSLTLNAESPDAVFIFQIGTTLTTASASSVNLFGEADPCNVFWQVGSSATLGTATDFVGTVVAQQSITATTGASVVGRLLALNGAVTLDTNTVTASQCDTTTTTSSTSSSTTTSSTTTTTTSSTTTTTSSTTTTRPATTTTTTDLNGGGGSGAIGTTTTSLGGGAGSDRRGPGPDAGGGHRTMPRTGSAVHLMTVAGVLAVMSGSLLLLVSRGRPAALGASTTRRR